MANVLRKHQKQDWINAPVLACPDFSAKMTLLTDVSNYGLGAVLTQIVDGHERVTAYVSQKLYVAELKCSPMAKECDSLGNL